jgi:manganese transport protein
VGLYFRNDFAQLKWTSNFRFNSMPNEAVLYIAIGIIGATVMPHNLYLHSSWCKPENTTEVRPEWHLKYNFIDSTIALIWPLVNAAILILWQPHFIKSEYHVAEIQDAI